MNLIRKKWKKIPETATDDDSTFNLRLSFDISSRTSIIHKREQKLGHKLGFEMSGEEQKWEQNECLVREDVS